MVRDFLFGAGQQEVVVRYTGLLVGLVSFILIIACVNVANLLMAQGMTRSKEMTIRRSLGATRARLRRMLLAENLVLVLFGGFTGTGLALAGLSVVEFLRLPGGLVPMNVRTPSELDLRALGFAILVSLISVVIFGSLPVLGSTRVSRFVLEHGLLSPVTHRSRLGMRDALVTVQIAVSLLVLTGAGFLAVTFHKLRHIDMGFDSNGVLTASLDIGLGGYRGAQAIAFYRELAERVQRLPGVDSVGMVAAHPILGAENSVDLPVESEAAEALGEPVIGKHVLVGGSYFRALGVEPRRGRLFDSVDRIGPAVVVVNETMAKILWPGMNPIGRRISIVEASESFNVIGVVPDSKFAFPREKPQPTLYIHHEHSERWGIGLALAPAMTLLIRYRTAEPAILADDLRYVVKSMEPRLPVFGVTTLTDRIEDMLAVDGQVALFSIVVAFFSVVLSLSGIYGIVFQWVVERTGELGIRIVCGATTGSLVGRFVFRGMSLSVTGVALGIGASLPVIRALDVRLYEVHGSDPLIYVCSTALLMALTLAACLFAARKISRTEPAHALRQL